MEDSRNLVIRALEATVRTLAFPRDRNDSTELVL